MSAQSQQTLVPISNLARLTAGSRGLEPNALLQNFSDFEVAAEQRSCDSAVPPHREYSMTTADPDSPRPTLRLATTDPAADSART